MTTAVIAGYVRTPFALAKKGPLAEKRPDDLAALAIRALVDRSDLDPMLLEDVIMGCSYPEGPQGSNIARIALLLAGLPDTVAGATVNRFCGSSMYAIHMAAGQIALGAGEAIVAAGVESMSMVPQGGLSPSRNPRFLPDNTGRHRKLNSTGSMSFPPGADAQDAGFGDVELMKIGAAPLAKFDIPHRPVRHICPGHM